MKMALVRGFASVGIAVTLMGVAHAQTVHQTLTGPMVGDQLCRVAAMGDVDGDGLADFIVGAIQGWSVPSNGPGYVWIVSGADGSVLESAAGLTDEDQFGWAVAGVGDLDGDEVPDALVGAWYDDASAPSAGSAHAISGATGNTIWSVYGESNSDFFGDTVGAVGDVDGDGVPDVAVGSNYDDNNGAQSGSVTVYSGADGQFIVQINGDEALDRVSRMAGVGDINGDEIPDLLVGAYENFDGPGYARVYSGADWSILLSFDGDASGDGLGYSVAAAGDVDGDGVPDMIVAAPRESDTAMWAGSVRVYSGNDGGLIHQFWGEAAEDVLGFSVAGGGDFDGDGVLDVLVGAPDHDSGGNNAGAVYVFSGADGSQLTKIDGAVAGAGLGTQVAFVGDVDGDGLDDIGVGSKIVEGQSVLIFTSDFPDQIGRAHV